ncbi:unnamed protein product [Rotaria magnacalcarata]|uniref:G-protein coupled receptors family 1 profile domain-containing protein n=2 Tax=Rotaria magnacalcarata TaxID=392030 RepID=A0A815W4C0_9BILA|nr:unnamed protein product [Rotaria magnacalcarata]CAF3841084.1 unnamed protein product [Rotaria magnacalcarata]CAF3849456.1 unnamed protein product [Rotaria magnacalcarata]CAF3863008.1 unnamed protein product [Rotaria magnacalcarata]
MKQRIITMSLIITLGVPSLLCFLIIFYYFFRLRHVLLMNRINHHVILCILISDFLIITTELPFTLSYLSLGYVRSSKLCLFWIYWNYTLPVLSLYLTMYAAIERYMLVFHKQIIMKHKILFHYMPLGFVCVYPFGIYIYLILIFPCGSNYEHDVTALLCGGACYLNDMVQNIYDTVVNTMLPAFTLLIFSLTMIGRVIVHKHVVSPSIPVSNTLKRNRRMILQLLGISLLTLMIWMPWIVIILVQDLYDPSFGEDFLVLVVNYLAYFASFGSPFFALIGLPEVLVKFMKSNLVGTVTIRRNVVLANSRT